MFRVFLALLGALVCVAVCHQPALGAPITGMIQLPARFQPTPVFSAPGFCEPQGNEVLKVLPPLVDPRTEMVVALEGPGTPVASRVKAVMRMQDARFMPAVLPVRPGEVITFRNDDSTVHILEPATDGKAKPKGALPTKRIQSGSEERHVFADVGTHQIRCSEVPHMRATILVTRALMVQVPDATGTFKFNDVPPGKYTLKVWYRGKWVIDQPLPVKRARGKISLKVQLPGSLGKGK